MTPIPQGMTVGRMEPAPLPIPSFLGPTFPPLRPVGRVLARAQWQSPLTWSLSTVSLLSSSRFSRSTFCLSSYSSSSCTSICFNWAPWGQRHISPFGVPCQPVPFPYGPPIQGKQWDRLSMGDLHRGQTLNVTFLGFQSRLAGSSRMAGHAQQPRARVEALVPGWAGPTGPGELAAQGHRVGCHLAQKAGHTCSSRAWASLQTLKAHISARIPRRDSWFRMARDDSVAMAGKQKTP